MSIRNLIHAYLLNRFVPRYNRMAGEVKSRLLAGVEGEVLEIGAGTGANFPYLPQAVRWTGCDPNPDGWRYCERQASAAGIEADWRTAAAEQLPFDGGRFDAVVSTLTLCSVRSPEKALREIVRVLKPGGTFIFLEHVAAHESSPLLRRQRLWAPVFGALAGCRPHQDTARLIAEAGFTAVELERLSLPLPVVGPHAAGRAVK
jgi:ubiquinone/menaquinone biosynthesis C-methylase UbiE